MQMPTFDGPHYVLVESLPVVVQAPLPLAIGQRVGQSGVVKEGTHQFPEEQAPRASVVYQDGVQLGLGDEDIIVLCQLHLRLDTEERHIVGKKAVLI